MTSSTASRQRPWTFGGRPKTKPIKIKYANPEPKKNYHPQMPRCQKLYDSWIGNTNQSFPHNRMRDRTFLSLNLPHTKRKPVEYHRDVEIDSYVTSSSDDIYKMDTDRRQCLRLTPAMLCEYLRSNGFGQPRILTSSYMKRESDFVIKPHPKPLFNLFSKHQRKRDKTDSQGKFTENINTYTRTQTERATHTHSSLSSQRITDNQKCVSTSNTKQQNKLKLHFKSQKTDSSENQKLSDKSHKHKIQRIEEWLKNVAKARTESTAVIDFESLENSKNGSFV